MIFLHILIFVFGLMVGSFLNVLIVRLPKMEDAVFTRSHCVKCNTIIRWFHNIPLVSFVFLRGKCAYCKEKISLQYPLVELLSAIGALLFISIPVDISGLFHNIIMFSAFSVFLCHFIIDFRHKILPDELTIYLAIIFLLNGVFFMNWQDSLLGGAVGFAIPYIISLVFYYMKGAIGLGGGDIKLYGALGLYLGPVGIIQNIFLSSFLGSIIGLILIGLKIKGKKEPIPFGPFIIVAASWQIFFPAFYGAFLSSISLFLLG